MRKMIVSGHLGNDPEVKTTNRGTKYTTFRIANHEYTDAEGVTYWFTVTVWEPTLQNFCKSLKKGSLVYVDGEYTDRTYTSNKTGQVDVGRDLRATAIYFGQGGGKRDEDTNTEPADVPETAPVQEAVTPKPAKPAKATKSAPAPEMPPADNGGDDDLPF